MPRVQSEKQINSFIKGIVTEANPLTYPENASIDEANFVLKRDGSRERRLGMNYEQGYALNNTGLTSSNMENTSVQFFQWDKAGGGKTLGIVRIYNKLWFLDLEKSNPSAYLLNRGDNVTLPYYNESADFSLINGSVLVISPASRDILHLEYDSDLDIVNTSNITLKVRDLWGVEDGLVVDERPTTLTDKHKYNLYNQGWTSNIKTSCGTDPITCTYSTLSKYPSNADIWSLGKDADANSANFEKYNPTILDRNSYNNSAAATGKYIIDIYDRGTSRTTVSGVTGLLEDKENNYISTCAAFAGRVFYSGIKSKITAKDKRSPNYSGYIFFTQQVNSVVELSKCYQEADPTSDDISDIVATDGGTIQIVEATQILKLISTKSSLLVFCANGIWEIFAGDAGFKATEYQVNKVTDIGITNTRAIVNVDGSVVYWANGGIYYLSTDQVTGRFMSQNISLPTIQTLYNDLPQAAKENAVGFFDEREYIIRWLYNDTTDGVYFKYNYNKELLFDVNLKAFYVSNISSNTTNSPFVAAYVTMPNYVSRDGEDNVVVGTDLIAVSGEQVVVTTEAQEARGVTLKYIAIKPGATYSFTMSEYNDDSFVDWKSDNGVGTNYSSYLVTGQEMFGDIIRNKQIPYIQFFFRRTEDGFDSSTELENKSSCLVQARWGWSDSASSGKWGQQFQAYRFRRNYVPSGPSDTFDYGESVIVTKNKLRGSGKAVSLYISSEQGKDMKLLGWAITMSGNSGV